MQHNRRAPPSIPESHAPAPVFITVADRTAPARKAVESCLDCLMRAVVQRVSQAQVSVGSDVVGRIQEPGLLVLVGITHTDTPELAAKLATKLWHLRILDGESSCAEKDAPLLVVSQFTLYADTTKGRRPTWAKAAPGPISEPLVEAVVTELRQLGARVETGRFGADMAVELVNDGPLTIVLDLD